MNSQILILFLTLVVFIILFIFMMVKWSRYSDVERVLTAYICLLLACFIYVLRNKEPATVMQPKDKKNLTNEDLQHVNYMVIWNQLPLKCTYNVSLYGYSGDGVCSIIYIDNKEVPSGQNWLDLPGLEKNKDYQVVVKASNKKGTTVSKKVFFTGDPPEQSTDIGIKIKDNKGVLRKIRPGDRLYSDTEIYMVFDVRKGSSEFKENKLSFLRKKDDPADLVYKKGDIEDDKGIYVFTGLERVIKKEDVFTYDIHVMFDGIVYNQIQNIIIEDNTLGDLDLDIVDSETF